MKCIILYIELKRLKIISGNKKGGEHDDWIDWW